MLLTVVQLRSVSEFTKRPYSIIWLVTALGEKQCVVLHIISRCGCLNAGLKLKRA